MKKIKRIKRMLAVMMLAMTMLICESTAITVMAQEDGGFRYEHNPMDNPKAAEDIVVNENAVYGFSPSPDSIRLKEFADAIDWTDAGQVAAAREERAQYHAKNAELYQMIAVMQGEGKSVEETARAVSRRRNEIRLESYADDPDGLAKVKQSNLDTYGNEEGPTADSLYAKYGSWQTVLDKALSTNPGMDACLGFYDEYYYTYGIARETDNMPLQDVSQNQTAALGTVYTVETGDCLWKIAFQFYQDGSLWKRIYDENVNRIRNPEIIYKGQVLEIPDAG